VRCGKNRNYGLTVATVVTRKAKEGVMAPMVGSGGVCVWRESGVVLVPLAGIQLQSSDILAILLLVKNDGKILLKNILLKSVTKQHITIKIITYLCLITKAAKC
jgi:hypothetical protein